MRAKKSLGQNFLVDPNLQRKIVEAVDPSPSDTVLEIGPGHGALTRHLVGRAGRLILVELDDELADELEGEWGDRPDVDVRHQDFLKLDLSTLIEDPNRLLVVGNIPYNITAPIIFKLLERPRPRDILLMVSARGSRPPGCGRGNLGVRGSLGGGQERRPGRKCGPRPTDGVPAHAPRRLQRGTDHTDRPSTPLPR